MNRYGQNITWGTISAPHLFSGECTSYDARDAFTRQLIDDQAGDQMAIVLHSGKTEISFEAKITSSSTNFLDLSAGAAITVSGISTGVVLCQKAIEKWTLGQAKTATINATWFPEIVQTSPAQAADSLTAFTPDQSGLGIVTPGTKIIYGTFGVTHTSGIVHALTIEQDLTITEDEPSPDGKILGAASHGYMRTISLDLLATSAAPNKGDTLALTGAPDHAGGYLIEKVETKYQDKRGKMYTISAVWIPPFSA